jgi:formylglycine-generating enzyme required for sulfatase activity
MALIPVPVQAPDPSLRSYCLDVTEVTVGSYRACVEAGDCAPAGESVVVGDLSPQEKALFSRACTWNRPERQSHPINCVTRAEATGYCAVTGRRLPTDSEWSWAALGGDERRRYPWGGLPPSSTLLNVCGVECSSRFAEAGHRWPAMHFGDDGWTETAPVGSFAAGSARWGIQDLAGNVWELVSDRPRDQQGLAVMRGGGWAQTSTDLVQSHTRAGFPVAGRSSAVGFRCAADAPLAPPTLADQEP